MISVWSFGGGVQSCAIAALIVSGKVAPPDVAVIADKPWYKSKAKLAAIVTALVACVQPVSTALGHPYQVPLWVIELLTGIGIYGVRDAIKPPQ